MTLPRTALAAAKRPERKWEERPQQARPRRDPDSCHDPSCDDDFQSLLNPVTKRPSRPNEPRMKTVAMRSGI